jgi:hypothetical protein
VHPPPPPAWAYFPLCEHSVICMNAHPRSLYLPSRTKLWCSLQLSGQILYGHPISTLLLYVLCGAETLLYFYSIPIFTLWIWLKSYDWLIYEYSLIYNPRFNIRLTPRTFCRPSFQCNYTANFYAMQISNLLSLCTRTLSAEKFHHLRPQIRDWKRVPAPPTI